MQSLLIVEDEKLIRQGIRTMAERSGVTIEQIYEANNGEAALKILQEHHIEVMFTDIRMPRMDGIELVHQVQTLKHQPYVVAISGFDDFSYAVEMLRSGATEYLLKPIERDKIRQVLTDLDQRISQEKEVRSESSYERFLREQDYAVALFSEKAESAIGRNMIRIPGVSGDIGILLSGEMMPSFQEEYREYAVGVSGIHHGEDELKNALTEAKEARRRAFCLERIVFSDEPVEEVPEKLYEHATGLLSEAKRTMRLQIIATEKQKEMIRTWGSLFEEARRGLLSPDVFFEEMSLEMRELRKIYRSVICDGGVPYRKDLEELLSFESISEYEEELLDFLVELNRCILKAEDEEPAQRKMAMAIAYIREHYAEDMNMATVSNYISMNYTLFSYSFKQYTGQNFVTYLKEIRLKAARELLETTDEKIIDIAHQVGYDNEKHFLKTFKSEFGVSPSEYRKNMQRAE